MAKNKTETTTAVQSLPSAEILAEQGWQELGKPEILKMRDMVIGAVIDCTIDGLQASESKGIDQPLFQATLTGTNRKVLIPAQASIANQLINNQGKCDHIGKRVLITKTGEKQSPTYKTTSGEPVVFNIYKIIVMGALQPVS